ncbi:MAG: histidine--tRNA ligase [Cytophagales bacterium]|nr:histidine--tRNA ligase [Cytophagales bacterium]
MSKQPPTLPKGTRDFSPTQLYRRNHIFDTIKHIFQKYGFLPLETPAFENLSVLAGKYGDEGDQLLFKILNTGDFLAKVEKEDIAQGYKTLLPSIAEKGLRYDLTVPFARYVVMNRNDITFPFRRYQIQPVWRADRPQKGRYREFYQCDADIIGTKSLVCEAEILAMVNEVFQQLGIHDFTIVINHRKLLTGIASSIRAAGKEHELCIAIDKLDKIGRDKVFKELASRGFTSTSLHKLEFIFNIQGTNEEKLSLLRKHLASSEEGSIAFNELDKLFQYIKTLGAEDAPITFDPTLARGLSYYTGAIFEVKVNNIAIGSVGGGGRYDNLTTIFGLPDVSGVGFSFGVDRIYEVMAQLNLFAQSHKSAVQIMLTNIDTESEKLALKVLAQLRSKEIKAEIYPSPVKLKKQLSYANKKNIPFVLIVSPRKELIDKFTLKNMHTGAQNQYTFSELVQILS